MIEQSHAETPASVDVMLASPQWRRTWPALLTLIALAPGVGELLSGSTPPLLIIQPFALIFLPPLYGASAVLIHDAMVRRQLGWGNVLLLGAAFGAFQEGLVVQTWFTYAVRTSPSHSAGFDGALGGINWLWALNLSIYHATISIAIPILLLRLFYPLRAQRPFLGKKGRIALIIWLLVPNSFLALNSATQQFAKYGYHGPPPLAYLLAGGVTLALIVLGLLVKFPTRQMHSMRPAPPPLRVGLTCALTLVTFFIVIQAILPTAHLPAPVMMALAVSLLAWILWRIANWSTRPGWNDRHRMAIALGVVGYFAFFWAPLVEFGLRLPLRTGMTVVNVLAFFLLALYTRRVSRRLVQVPAVTNVEHERANRISSRI